MIDNPEAKILKTGTTTVGIVTKEGVVLATESQATMGYLVATTKAPKIYEITPRIAMTISGSVADCQQIVRVVRANTRLHELESGMPISVKAVARLTANILFQNRLYPYISQLLIGGLDEGGPHLFSLDPLGSLLEEPEFASTGSGSVIAYGVLESEYKKDMTIKDAVTLAKTAIIAAKKRDTASGGEIQIVTITKDGLEWIKN
ncbi:MAG: archaeal proteasome endopeptidase complex subunit beta [Candidatus Asgardarchaeia archaeon]